jgi:excinuclease ABC subunit C
VEKHFRLRTCTDRELKSRSRPCIQYQIQRCPAPCVFEVDREDYGAQVRTVELFLSGRHDQLSQELNRNMKEAAKRMDFEVAAIYRDQIEAVQKVREKQRVVSVTDLDQDVLGLYREGELVELSVVLVRQGRVIEIFTLSETRTMVGDDEVVAAFLRDYYGEDGLSSATVPDEILVPVLPEGAEGVAEWLSDRRLSLGHRSKADLISPQRGGKKMLLDLAQENAKHAFAEKRRENEDMDARLAEVQAKLRLPHLPRRIECCDISHLGGESTVGSVVALLDGVPNKKNYKAYKVKSTSDGDDYQAMYEVLLRRFRRGLENRASETISPDGEVERGGAETWDLPDLFVVDGGRGQLGVALAAAADLGLSDLSIVGLAKERETVTSEKLTDRVYLPGQKNPIALRPNTPELFMLARARDEAHRFANYQRERLGKKRRFTSVLDDISGIGPKTRKALLVALGSVEGIAEAADETILAIPGVTKKHLAALRGALRPPEGEDYSASESPAADDAGSSGAPAEQLSSLAAPVEGSVGEGSDGSAEAPE